MTTDLERLAERIASAVVLRVMLALEQSIWKRYKLAEDVGEGKDAAVLLTALNALAEARKVL